MLFKKEYTKWSLTLVAIALMLNSGMGQSLIDTNKVKWYIKLYNNNLIQYGNDYNPKNNTVDFFSPSVSLAYRFKNLNSLEFEFMGIRWRRVHTNNYQYEMILKSQLFYSRITFNFRIKKILPSKPRFEVYIATGFSFKAQNNKTLPINSTYAYITGNKSFDIAFHITPRIKYHFTKRVFCDLSIIYDYANFGFSKNENQNPVIPPKNQKQGNYDIGIIPNHFTIRTGIGVNI